MWASSWVPPNHLMRGCPSGRGSRETVVERCLGGCEAEGSAHAAVLFLAPRSSRLFIPTASSCPRNSGSVCAKEETENEGAQ